MLNYLLKAKQFASRRTYRRYVTMQIGAPRAVAGFFSGIRNATMLLGISAMVTLGVMFVKPDVADRMLSLSPFADKTLAEQKAGLAQFSAQLQPATDRQENADDTDTGLAEGVAVASVTNRQQQMVTDWLAKRYRVANDAANMLVSAAYVAAVETKLDPLLILAVIGIESRFNPFAESPMGAQGLMQVMSRVHKERFDDHGGVKAALNPVANIKVGSQILKDYVRRGGSVEAGLKIYVGAAAHDNDGGYGAKVLSEYRRLKDVASGKKVPSGAPVMASSKRPIEKADEQAEPAEREDRDDLAAATGKDNTKRL